MNNKDLIERLRYPVGASKTTISEAADALEAADKRIEEEREQHDIMMERGAEKLAEAERKLSVALEALARAGESAGFQYMTIETRDCINEALAQIGENK